MFIALEKRALWILDRYFSFKYTSRSKNENIFYRIGSLTIIKFFSLKRFKLLIVILRKTKYREYLTLHSIIMCHKKSCF